MAYTDVVAQKLDLTLPAQSGAECQINIAPKDSTGAGVDITGWVSPAISLAPSGGLFNSNMSSNQTPTLNAASAGAATLSAILTFPPGKYSYCINAKPTSGDQPQTLAFGTLTLV